jgi:hypothetical protein
LEAATNVTTPVAAFSVYVPSPAIVTMPSASHNAGDEPGVMRHVELVLKPATAVARPLLPVKVVKATVPPGMTDFDCGVALGAVGADTVGVIVAFVNWLRVSATTYLTADALPMNVGNGSNVIVPFAFTVYVPSFATVNVVRLQLAFAVLVVAHNFTDDASIGASEPAVSLVSGEIV